MKLTTKQTESLNKLKKRYQYVSEPYPLLGDPACAMVEVANTGFIDMTLGIETDGHIHS